MVIATVTLALMLVLATRVVPHPVGAARTDGKYQGKAVTTAKVALSSVNTTSMIARTFAEGNSFTPYAALVASDAEGAVSGVQGTFDSIQPPSTKSDAVAEKLDPLLTDVAGHVRDVRIALRRGEPASEHDLRNLDDDAQRLNTFIESHS